MMTIRLTLLSLIFPLILFGQYDYEVTTLIPEGSNIVDDGLANDENGIVYGAYWGIWQGTAGTHIIRYYPSGQIDTLAQGMLRPNGISYANGYLYAASGGQNRIVRIDTNTGDSETFATLANPSSVAVVPGTDSLVSVSFTQEKLFGISPEGEVTELSNSPLLNGPVGIIFDTDGILHVSNFNDGKILQYNGDGIFESIADIGGGVGFITFSNGAILATNHVLKNVWRIPQSGIGVEVIAGSGTAEIVDGTNLEASFRSPNGIVATANGDTIYVSEFMGKALRRIVRTPGTLSRNPIQDGNEIKVYPNPTTGKLVFNMLYLAEIDSVEVLTLEGTKIKTIRENKVNNGFIDLSAVPDGFYILKMVFKNGYVKSERIQVAR